MEIKQSLRDITAEELVARIEAAAKANTDDYYDLQRFANYFEHLGTLHKLKCLQIEWIDEMLGSSVMEFWDIWKPAVEQDRARWPKLYENWELIANRVRQRRGQ